MDPPERFQARERVESVMVEVQRHLRRELVEESGPGLYGYFNGENIHLSAEELEAGVVQENGDTVLGEGRLAYRQHAVDILGSHPDESRVEIWRENLPDYKDPQHAIEECRKQPFEADAWSYASAIVAGLEGSVLEGDVPWATPRRLSCKLG